MTVPANLHWIASVAAERMIFSLGIGTLVAAMAGLLLRVSPRKDSRTSFAVWFSTLLITAALPLATLFTRNTATEAASSQAVITVSASWAVYIFLAWACLALAGLMRVAFAVGQVYRLRRESQAVDARRLAPELNNLVEEFRQARPVSLLFSEKLTVPTAVGFFHPAVILPRWLLEETPAEELKYIVLHELAHLRRRDDWTNLAQQVVKAFLFFVPSVWWIERKLSLEREMACDDAVLAHSGTPQGYAESLAHVAQRSFMRRQMALVQAAVSRMRQLTLRMAKILDPQRQQSGKPWRPAVPMVVVAAGLCAFSASRGPALVGFADEAPSNVTSSAIHWQEAGKAKILTTSFAQKPSASEPAVRAWNAALKSSETPARVVRSKHVLRKKNVDASVPRMSIATLAASDKQPMTIAELQLPEIPQAPEYVTVREEFVMVVTQRPGSSVPESWQMHVVQFVVGPARRPEKQVPRKI